MTETFAGGAVLTASPGGRVISGVVVPYGVPGKTNLGVLSVRAGSVRLPEPLSRLKLLGLGHDRESAVGYAINAESKAYGLVVDFKIAATPAGDRALLEASEHVRDAFSVELDNLTIHRDGGEVVGADLVAVAQLAVPAYADARVTSVAATRGDSMTTQPAETDPNTETDDDDGDGTETETERETTRETETETEREVRAASRPSGLVAGGARTRTQSADLSTLYAAMSHVATDQRLTPEMRAALYDVTHSANPWVQPTQYENQLWSGVAYGRQIVPLLTQRNLTSYKITGWRWKTKPEVDDYAGDKAEVPTNPAETEQAETEALRLAGAHDIDRKFRDFGDTGFFQAYYEAMAESYAIKTDEAAAQFLIDNATPVPDAPANSLIDAVDIGVDNIAQNANVAATFALVSGQDWRDMVSTKASDMPGFIALMDFQPNQFIRSRFVPAGTVIVGARPAVSWYERAGSPIRVETVDLAHGGIDGGVFGYYAMLLNNAAGLVSVALAADTEPPAGE